MRLFIALPVSDEVKKIFSDLISRMSRTSPAQSVRWVKPGQCHLTLEFLGETDEQRVSELKTILAGLSEETEPLNFSLKQLGAFPDWNKPSVIILKTGHSAGAESLQAQLSAKLRQAGFPASDREWKPHLTLGRIKKEITVPEAWKKIAAPEVKWTAGQIELVESRLAQNGPDYRVIGRFSFKRR